MNERQRAYVEQLKLSRKGYADQIARLRSGEMTVGELDATTGEPRSRLSECIADIEAMDAEAEQAIKLMTQGA